MTVDLDVIVELADRADREETTAYIAPLTSYVRALVEELRQLREAVDTYVLSREPTEKAAE